VAYSTALTAYNLGDTVRLTFTVQTTSGAAIDTPVRLLVGPSTGEAAVQTSTAGLSHPGIGSWRYDAHVTAAGRWTYRWESTGTVVQVDEGAFAVAMKKASTS